MGHAGGYSSQDCFIFVINSDRFNLRSSNSSLGFALTRAGSV
jgi:hypothetical protein